MADADIERAFWDELKGLCRENKVKEFYIKYAEYLKWAGIYSESRMCLYKMAVAVGNINLGDSKNELLG